MSKDKQATIGIWLSGLALLITLAGVVVQIWWPDMTLRYLLPAVLFVIGALLYWLSRRNSMRLYQSRKDPDRPSMTELIERCHVMWIATHVGGMLANTNALQGPIKQLILQNPESSAFTGLSSSVTEHSESYMRGTIIASAYMADQKHIEVREFNGQMTSVLIGNPESETDGWAQVEAFLPYTDSGDRPSFFFKQKDYPKAFEALVLSFRKTWARSVPPAKTDTTNK